MEEAGHKLCWCRSICSLNSYSQGRGERRGERGGEKGGEREEGEIHRGGRP